MRLIIIHFLTLTDTVAAKMPFLTVQIKHVKYVLLKIYKVSQY